MFRYCNRERDINKLLSLIDYLNQGLIKVMEDRIYKINTDIKSVKDKDIVYLPDGTNESKIMWEMEQKKEMADWQMVITNLKILKRG
jgi:hypothetical protein